MLRIAKVAVDLSLDREFDYLIPEPLRPLIEIGSRVEVPFRSRSVAGFVVGFSDVSAFDDLKSIEKVLGEKSLVTETVMDLARWMSSYYLAPFEACVRSVLPAVVRNKESGEKKQLVVSLVEENVVATPLVDTVSSTCFFGFDPACPVSHLPGGNLPHWRQDGTTYFVTFRLADSLPKETLNQWQRERDEWMEKNPRPCAERDEDIASTEETFAQDVDAMSSSRLLEWQHEYRARFTERFDTWLDAGNGRCILKNPEIRKVVQEVLHCFCGARYELYSYVIMPNHVHVLVSPFGEYTLSNIIKGWKSVSTREMNALLGTKEAVWQKESFDHIVRSAESLAAFRTYISQNPVGLNADSYFLYDRDRDGGIASTVTPKQQAVIDYLKDNGSVLLSELTAIDGFSAATVKALEKKGLVTISNESVYRDPHAGIELLKTEPMRLMEQQAVALKQIIVAIDEPEPPVILLHGVTGSGKTEVYLQAIAHALEQDRGAIVLVPEIALTPQTVDRFRARFADKPERVAVLHSSLSDGERYDEWHRIRSGEAQIVIGARSALFAPVHRIGLIVVDEEHEPTYKQDEAPRYSARDTAVMRGRMEKCAVVLGSATPALESYANSKNGKYRYADLPIRVDDRRMPAMRIVDMRIEMQRDGGKPRLFSRELIEAIRIRLDRSEQTMIFMNRRGFSSSLMCPDCGYVAECEHCSVGMTYHKARAKLVCHICGDEKPVPVRCPECKSDQFRYAGAGTEKIEEVMLKLFPNASIERMDSDTMRRKNAHRDLLGKFRSGKIDILIGTQMIAKGLDFPNVTLVGVVNPDHALHMADFRAGERVFQLLTQVAGRAGRGAAAGEVFVQTYTPHHPAIQAARRMDFEGFCDQEMAFRKELGYPPYTHLICITLRGKEESAVGTAAEEFYQWLEKNGSGIILSPAMPAPIARMRGEYRWQILLRAARVKTMSDAIRAASGKMKWPKSIKVTVDVDATSLL